MIESVHPELEALTKSVKALLKQKGLGDVSRGGLGSHAVTCALVCYLNHVKRQMKDGKEGKRGEKDGKRGEKEEKEDGELDAEVGTVDLGEAFVGFPEGDGEDRRGERGTHAGAMARAEALGVDDGG